MHFAGGGVAWVHGGQGHAGGIRLGEGQCLGMWEDVDGPSWGTGFFKQRFQ